MDGGSRPRLPRISLEWEGSCEKVWPVAVIALLVGGPEVDVDRLSGYGDSTEVALVLESALGRNVERGAF